MKAKRLDRDFPPSDDPPAAKRRKDVDSDLHNPHDTAIRLLRLLLQCAEYVATENLQEASSLLLEISEISSPFASSPERVVAYFAQALQARVFSSCLGAYTPLTAQRSLTMAQSQKIFAALQSYNSVSPLIKFSHFTANQVIFEAVEGEDRVHIIDLDVMQGLQWPALFHILASRPRKLRSVRITGFGSSSVLLASTGRRLADFAASLDLPFEFNPVEGKLGDLTELSLSQLGVRSDESVVVHWMQHRLYDVTGSDAGALEALRRIRPRLVTVVEQDLSRGGERSFLGRFVEALHHYSALFDALGEGMEEENAERYTVEEQLFGREIKNVVVGRGERKVERWWEELSRVGFRPVSLRGNPAAQAGLLLGMMPWKGYSLVEDNGTLRLGWKDLSLLTASAWLSPPSP
ncbi:PREDICTED: scarecrow-like protein 23 isoform X3 [Tarenaya hassleriana]|uniref:scarecrow-like protein 23 isoform X2 n=1 Tax=Tarenaya hassleriana TaxID=28532 RepID=UPI0008FD86A1|nr:PREDICTED: scarecrow-like protein 23 isoform X2 [Tarenaya hassleriana]XP_019059489.1 PREDICTED: scarecrow-like protein 23 isoform X3 [Tarenaya hassleriana]